MKMLESERVRVCVHVNEGGRERGEEQRMRESKRVRERERVFERKSESECVCV